MRHVHKWCTLQLNGFPAKYDGLRMVKLRNMSVACQSRPPSGTDGYEPRMVDNPLAITVTATIEGMWPRWSLAQHNQQAHAQAQRCNRFKGGDLSRVLSRIRTLNRILKFRSGCSHSHAIVDWLLWWVLNQWPAHHNWFGTHHSWWVIYLSLSDGDAWYIPASSAPSQRNRTSHKDQGPFINHQYHHQLSTNWLWLSWLSPTDDGYDHDGQFIVLAIISHCSPLSILIHRP